MEDVVEIEQVEQQQPQQEEPPKKKLYKGLVEEKLYTKSYDEFVKQYSTPESLDKLHKGLLEEKLYSKSRDEFQKQYFSDTTPAPKKKVSSVTIGESYSSPENDIQPLPTVDLYTTTNGEQIEADPFTLSRKYNELKSATKEVEGLGDRGTMKIVPDEEKIKAANKIKEDLGDMDADQIFNETKDLTEEDIALHGKELLHDRNTNKELYNRKVARLNWKRGLDNELASAVEGGSLSPEEYDNLQFSINSSLENSSVGDYKQQRSNVNSVANAIKQYGGANKEKLLRDYAVEISKVYGNSYNSGFDKTVTDSPESKYLDNDEQLGLHYIQDLAPDKAQQYERLMVDPKSIKDNPDAQKAVNHLKQTLAETGLGLQQNSISEELNNLKNIAEENGGLSPEQVLQAEKLQTKQEEINQKRKELDSKYPDRLNDKVDDAMQEILGQKLGWGSYAAGSAGKAIKNTAQGIWEAVSSPFMSDSSNRLRELSIMGETLFDNKVYHKSDANKALVTDTLVIEPELQSQIDAITNDKSLTREQKEYKLYPLLKDNADKFGRVPIQGGKFNVSPSSILYGITDLGTTLLPFIGLEAATGGIGGAGMAAKFLRTFTAAASTSFHDEYANALLEGKSESDAYKTAMGVTAINSLAMAGAGTPDAIRNMAGLKTSAGKVISQMSDKEIQSVLNKGGNKTLNALKERIGATPKMLQKGAEGGAKFEVAMNVGEEVKSKIYNTEIDRDEQFKRNVLGVANFGILGGVLGHAGYKSPTNLQKSGLVEFGKNPDSYIFHAEEMKKNGELTQSEFDQRKALIEKSGEAFKTLPELNDKGKPITPKQQGEILYNTVIKNDAKKAASTLPPRQAEKAEMTAMVADFKNGIILEEPTTEKLESRQRRLEKMLEPKPENSEAAPIPEKQLKEAKAELQAVKETIEERSKVVEETKAATVGSEADDIKTKGTIRIPAPHGSGKDFAELPRVLIRFGDAAKNDKGEVIASSAYAGGKKGGQQEGVSVFEAGYDPRTGHIVINSGNEALSLSLQEAILQKRKIYLVEGNESGYRGEDFEVQIDPKTYKVQKEISPDIVVEDSSTGDLETAVSGKELGDKFPKYWTYEYSKSENSPIQNEEAKATNIPIEAEVKEPTVTEVSEVIEPTSEAAGGKEPPKVEPVSEGAFVEPKRTVLSHRGLQEVATEFGLDDITSRERKSDLQLFKDAETTINKWVEEGDYGKKIEGLVKAAEDKQVLNDTDRIIVQQHLANIRNEANVAKEKFGVNSKEFDTALQELKRVNRAGMLTRSAAGAALRIGDGMSSIVRYDVPDMMAAKMEALNVDKLTDVQKSQIEKESLEIEKRTKVAEEKLAMYESKIAEYKAKSELNNKTRWDNRKPQVKKKSKEDFAIERKSLKDKLKQQFTEFQEAGQKLGISSDGNVESFVISAKMAKTIMEIVKSHVEEVGSKLDEITKRVFNEVKDIFPSVSEKDIHDVIAGKYNEKSKTKSQLQLDLQELQVEARLINKLEALEKGEVPKTEKALREHNQKIKELRDKIKASDVNKLTTIKERNIAAANKIIEKIKKGEFDKPKESEYLESQRVKKAYPQQYKEAMDAIAAKENAKHEFEIALLKDAQSKRSFGKKYIYDPLKDVIGTTKALRTGIDFSAIFIQNIVPLLSHPVIGAKSIMASFRDFASTKKFERALAELHNSPEWNLMQKSGLDITEPKSLEARNKEEIFNRNLLEKDITIAGKKYNIGKYLTAPFERAFVSLGNHIRAIAFLTEAAKLEKDGKTFESHPKEFKDLAKLLNTQTGRGSLPDFINKSTETVNTVIWSPRLMASRLNLLGLGDIANPIFAGRKGFYAGLTPRMRKKAVGDFVQFVGTVLAVYAAAGLITGAQSDLDPQSATFGEIKDPNSTKSYNMFGGFSPYVKLAAILATGKRKLGEKEEDITDSKGKTRLDIATKFLRGKVTPVAGAVLNTVEGKDYLGNPTDAGTEIQNLVTPLSLSGIPKDFKRDGLVPAFANGLISVTGIGVKDSRDFDRKSTKTFIIKNEVEGTKREATEKEYKDYEELRDKLGSELEKEIQDNKEVGLDKYGDVTLSESAIVDYKPYDKLSEEEKKDLFTKIKAKAGRQAKKELFGDGQDD